MRYGVTLPPFVEWSDPLTVVEMAAEADAAGWDGFFLWDHVTWNPAWGGTPPIADAWTCLAAAATATSHVLLGTLVTPLARRRPQILARQVLTVDHLSGGRALLGVGLGADYDFKVFGEPLTARGEVLDESLAVLAAMFAGGPVDFDGRYHHVHCPPMLPTPVNGTIPIWVGGHWPNRAPFERAVRFEGVVPRKADDETGLITTDDLRAIRVAVGREDDFAYVASGSTSGPDDVAAVSEWVGAGATWWLESLYPFGGRAGQMRDRLRAGPPRVPDR
jgi:alkanesulfonate monooxygenase SsuD/methylene tetrahydromethanopterin reductase-like flavin-dependent oxidoreductase (luciferase family)